MLQWARSGRRRTVLTAEEEALAVTLRKHTLLPLDDCLYALQATIPHLTRSSLHRLFQRHRISRLPDTEGDRPKKRFKPYPIGFFHIDIAEVRTEQGKLYLFVAIDRTSKFAFAQLHEKAAFANGCWQSAGLASGRWSICSLAVSVAPTPCRRPISGYAEWSAIILGAADA